VTDSVVVAQGESKRRVRRALRECVAGALSGQSYGGGYRLGLKATTRDTTLRVVFFHPRRTRGLHDAGMGRIITKADSYANDPHPDIAGAESFPCHLGRLKNALGSALSGLRS